MGASIIDNRRSTCLSPTLVRIDFAPDGVFEGRGDQILSLECGIRHVHSSGPGSAVPEAGGTSEAGAPRRRAPVRRKAKGGLAPHAGAGDPRFSIEPRSSRGGWHSGVPFVNWTARPLRENPLGAGPVPEFYNSQDSSILCSSRWMTSTRTRPAGSNVTRRP